MFRWCCCHRFLSCLTLLLLSLLLSACSPPMDSPSRVDNCKQYAERLLTQSMGLSKPPNIRWLVVKQQQEEGVQLQVVLGFAAVVESPVDDGELMNNLVCQYPYLPAMEGSKGEYEASPYGLVFNNQMIHLTEP